MIFYGGGGTMIPDTPSVYRMTAQSSIMSAFENRGGVDASCPVVKVP